MKKLLSALSTLWLLAACSQAPIRPAAPPEPYPDVALLTSMGTIVVELDRARAPLSVDNFLHYVNTGFYDGTLFERVVPGFVIQGGGFNTAYKEKKTGAPIPNEAGNGLSNLRGTIAMAREDAPHTATAQFYINLVDNKKLDPRPDRWGYAVFGKVIQGMDVVDRIAAVTTGKTGPFEKDAPLQQVVILKARVLKQSLD
ncbi:MAG TPA: peptidylprolyl isomerase [Gammaproteobacteria bacterium]|nr:peptidylprolyl isomerase [Gammaproteobacteria bacterium]